MTEEDLQSHLAKDLYNLGLIIPKRRLSIYVKVVFVEVDPDTDFKIEESLHLNKLLYLRL